MCGHGYGIKGYAGVYRLSRVGGIKHHLVLPQQDVYVGVMLKAVFQVWEYSWIYNLSSRSSKL